MCLVTGIDWAKSTPGVVCLTFSRGHLDNPYTKWGPAGEQLFSPVEAASKAILPQWPEHIWAAVLNSLTCCNSDFSLWPTRMGRTSTKGCSKLSIHLLVYRITSPGLTLHLGPSPEQLKLVKWIVIKINLSLQVKLNAFQVSCIEAAIEQAGRID